MLQIISQDKLAEILIRTSNWEVDYCHLIDELLITFNNQNDNLRKMSQ